MDYFNSATAEARFESFIDNNPAIEFVRHVWVDFSGILRVRILTTSHCRKIYKSGRRYGVFPGAMLTNVTETEMRHPRQKTQLLHLVPDWNSIRVCHFAPAHAWVSCFVHCAEEPNPLFQCPRFLLAKVLERAKQVTDAKFLFGCEIEFMLLDASMKPLETVDDVVQWSTFSGLRDRKLNMMEDIIRTLQRSDIEVSAFHTEGFNHLEYSTDPYEPMQTADVLMYTYECTRAIAVQYGYRATLAVKPLPRYPTTTNGLHFSISRTDQADHFLAGILHRLPWITPFAMPNHDSYKRGMIDRRGTWIGWGTENREMPFRKIEDGHWELRLSDPTANIYMLIAVMMSAGLDGIRDRQPLVWQDVRYLSSQMTEEEMAELGVTERLASSLNDSLDIARKSDELEALLGSEMKRLYVETRQFDEDVLWRMTDEQRRLEYIKHY